MSNIGFRVFTDIERPSKELVKKFEDLPVATIADNMNRLGCMNWQIKPINEFEKVHLTGTAVTVKTNVADNLMVHKAILTAKEGDIIVVDACGNVNAAIIGEIMCRYAKSQGIKGFIIDGLVRDIDAIKNMKDFIVFAKGAIPKGPFKEGPGEVNVPISCGGIEVNPGDIIAGDQEGVVSVNPKEAEEIIDDTKAKIKREKELLEKIKSGTLDRSWIDEKLEEKGCEII